MSQTSKKPSHGGKRAGAGRKPQYDEAVMIAALIPTKLRDKLDRFAKSRGLSRSQAIVEAIRQLKWNRVLRFRDSYFRNPRCPSLMFDVIRLPRILAPDVMIAWASLPLLRP